jgi:hypothetical protein
MNTDKFSQAVTTERKRSTKNAGNDTNKTSVTEANQNTTNINEKEKLIICKIVFCGLATRSVNIVIQITVAKNNIRYRAVIDRNYCYRRALKKQGI